MSSLMLAALLMGLSVVLWACDQPSHGQPASTGPATQPATQPEKVVKSDEEWRRTLTPAQYYILRQKGTERPFTGQYWDSDAKGTYYCAGCGQELFHSEQKFFSECGWPSFSEAVEGDRVKFVDDSSHGMRRIEVQCANCGGHLGHVFNDGPAPTHKRYCINSESLIFKPAK